MLLHAPVLDWVVVTVLRDVWERQQFVFSKWAGQSFLITKCRPPVNPNNAPNRTVPEWHHVLKTQYIRITCPYLTNTQIALWPCLARPTSTI